MTTTGDIPTTVSYVTTDVKPAWLNVTRRLQSACHGNQGYAVLEIRILVDAGGSPVCWSEPSRTKIEPKSLGSALLDMTS